MHDADGKCVGAMRAAFYPGPIPYQVSKHLQTQWKALLQPQTPICIFDLVIALTGGGPGYATDLPATYMYTMAFARGDIGQAASSAMVMMESEEVVALRDVDPVV